ncbi:alpha/beta fold hydrolase [Lentzea sp. HUAS12]|uniref:alpha/beta fold hydrolase n=1 Tax=Lentzea sp. HUAS12 TaxID=2951806 RepID=UPI00209F7AC0|nr:alpha/beta hydrolase [Lentzea sp. HUAS12]USX55722.1 alpha/beta hydrolase [Lentzea sp. HUAS12]
MFEGFSLRCRDVGEAVLRVRTGGAGPPVLLLHGHPRTHTTWHRVAPLLATDHTVVCPDLRGYGESSKPGDYSKRAMARDFVELMRQLGHEEFAVAGHDRGAAAAIRLALDHPDRVTHLAVLDGLPIGAHLSRADARFAQSWYHWFFLARQDLAAAMINENPDLWYGGRYHDTPLAMGVENWADFQRAIHDPETVHAMCGDYRAGLEVDRVHDDEDFAAGRRITCPVLALWSAKDDLGELYGDLGEIWAEWADDVRIRSLDCGHHMAEEAPVELVRELRTLF